VRKKQSIVAVIGGGRERSRRVLAAARAVGAEIARRNAILISGGLGGVMRSAARGAREEGGITVGLLPGEARGGENPFISIPIATGLGIARNAIIARSADALVAVGGEYGTLSEIALALQLKKTVVGLGSWDIPGVVPAETPEEAVALALARRRKGRRKM